MRYAQFTEVLDAGDQLLEQPASFFFSETRLRSDVVEQLSIAAVFHYQEDATFGLDNFVKLDYVRVLYYFEDVDLTGNPLNVVHVVNLPLVQDLYCHSLPCVLVDALLHLSESALAEGPFNSVVAYHVAVDFLIFNGGVLNCWQIECPAILNNYVLREVHMLPRLIRHRAVDRVSLCERFLVDVVNDSEAVFFIFEQVALAGTGRSFDQHRAGALVVGS